MAKNDKGSNGSAMATTNGGEVTIDQLGQAEALAMSRPASAQSIAARIAAGELESAPILFTIEQGMEIKCEVLDSGTTEVEDMATRNPKTVRTWILQMYSPEDPTVKGPKISILGSAQLDRQLPALMGMRAVIVRGGTTKTGKGRIMTDYFVGLDKAWYIAHPNASAGRVIDVRS